MRRLVAAVVAGAWSCCSSAAPALVARGSVDDAPAATAARPRSRPPAAPPATPAARRRRWRRFYAQHLDWSACGDGDRVRDADRAARLRRPDGRDHRAAAAQGAGRRPGVADRLAGGQPRRSGRARHVVRRSAGRVLRRPAARRTSTSSASTRAAPATARPVDCLSDAELDAYLAGDPDPDTPAEVAAFTAAAAAARRAAARRLSGALAAHVSTVEAARDMDVLRAALGERELNYFGASYGTKLGATYAELFPAAGRPVRARRRRRPRRSAPAQLALQQAAGFETALRAYVANCVESTVGCFLGDSVDAGLAHDQQLSLDRIAQQPLPAGRPRADGRQRVLRHRRAALQPRLLDPAEPGAARGARRRRLAAAAARRRLRRAQPRRHLPEQLARGVLRHQLPRRPVVDPAARCPRSSRPSRRRRRPSAGSSPGA